ncbi:hypothetical protein A7P95_01700 [Eikenella longinqua]|uniref:Uncharacterized protein n=1 Tax=Eikenella longinqua TaxID=1795827 RepID=A0A1A9S1H1_9NEIS|nr:hypothetical protein A7P95_01700 [Eikenella longinqua]
MDSRSAAAATPVSAAGSASSHKPCTSEASITPKPPTPSKSSSISCGACQPERHKMASAPYISPQPAPEYSTYHPAIRHSGSFSPAIAGLRLQKAEGYLKKVRRHSRRAQPGKPAQPVFR